MTYIWAIHCGSFSKPMALRDERLVRAYFTEVYSLFLKRLKKLKNADRLTDDEADSLKHIFSVLIEAKRMVDSE